MPQLLNSVRPSRRNAEGSSISLGDMPAETGVPRLIAAAAAMGASDLFIVTNEDHIAVQARHLGMVRDVARLGLESGRRYMAHIRANAGMDVSERRRPADGRWIYETEAGEAVDLRINTIPTMYGEDFAMRLLDRRTGLLPLESLGLERDQLGAVLRMLESPAGMILICGPTGAGKTATLYSCLSRLNTGRRKIHTIENPIEFAMNGLRQSQVNPGIGLGFSEMLRSVLRQAPDVVMLGEIRDTETATTAVHAANSGMLVLATIHAPSAAGAVQSMRALGANNHFLATSLLGVVSQRLVRTLCASCRESIDLSDATTFEEIRPMLADTEGRSLSSPRGCAECAQSGYAGRTGVFEVMNITREIRNLIGDNGSTRELRAAALGQKMPDFRQAALLKVARGITSTEEIFRVIPAEHLLIED